MRNIILLGTLAATVVLSVLIRVPVTEYGAPATRSVFELWMLGIQWAATLEMAPGIGAGEQALTRILATGAVAVVLPLLPTFLMMAFLGEADDFRRNPRGWLIGLGVFLVIAAVFYGLMFANAGWRP